MAAEQLSDAVRDWAQQPGWWLLPLLAVAQLLAEPVRRWIRRRRHAAALHAAAAATLARALAESRATASATPLAEGAATAPPWVDPVLARPAIRRLRRAAREQRGRALGGSALLALLWFSALAACWRSGLDADWRGLPPLAVHHPRALLVGAAVGGLLALWLALLRHGDPAAFERALTQVVLVAGSAVAVSAGLAPPRPAAATVLSAGAIALSPVLARVASAASTRAPAPALPAAGWQLLRDAEQRASAETARRAPLLPAVPREYLTRVGPLGRHRHLSRVRVTPPDRLAAPGAADEDAVERGWTPQLPGFEELNVLDRAVAEGEVLVLKEFDPPGTDGARNPTRPLGPYRRLLSRVFTLPRAQRELAGRVLLWPQAVVGADGLAVGVLYRPIGPPFLLPGAGRDDAVQTGDFLWAQDPEHMGCAVPDLQQRGEILLDLLRGHELLERLGLAHGDTGWKNLAYGLPETGPGRGLVIDLDGVTDVEDPAPLLLHQLWWELPPQLRPRQRDRARCALLVARLAGVVPSPDRHELPAPEQTLDWCPPALRRLTARGLADPRRAAAAGELARALERGLRAAARAGARLRAAPPPRP